jgi:hypothetical protein
MVNGSHAEAQISSLSLREREPAFPICHSEAPLVNRLLIMVND